MNNTFDGIGTGTRPFAIGLSGRTNLISGNLFSNMLVGILLFGQDQDFGTDLGITIDAKLIDNHFCAVPTALITEPLVTGVTEQGTLACPFPATLEIAPAVILSWPSETEGWILESSATAQGQWSAEAAPAILDGHNIISIKLDSTHHFFRLRRH